MTTRRAIGMALGARTDWGSDDPHAAGTDIPGVAHMARDSSCTSKKALGRDNIYIYIYIYYNRGKSTSEVAFSRPVRYEKSGRLDPCSMNPSYAARNTLLKKLGFPSYPDYLDSLLWATIRDAVLDRDERRCRLCQGEARAVHHIDYEEATLLGDCIDTLVSICHACHERIEFTRRGVKRTLVQAAAAYLTLTLRSREKPLLCRKRNKYNKRRVIRCVGCGNPAKKNSTMCRPCLKTALTGKAAAAFLKREKWFHKHLRPS